MAKLFVAVVPDSECERNIKRITRAFEPECKTIVKEQPDERDCNYYEMDCSAYPGLEKTIYNNLVAGKYAKLGYLVMKDELMRFTYGYYRSCVKDNDYTLDEFINTEG